jgi:kynurenine formamidase
MLALIDNKFQIDLSKPLDISIPLTNTDANPIAWYIEKPQIEPVKFGDWIGKVSEGSSTNFNNIFFNPHGHGTHTECLGHITREFYSINQCLKQFFFTAELISVEPMKMNNDLVISKESISNALDVTKNIEALIIRTLPNTENKKHKNYSKTNPPYLAEATAIFIREIGIKHLLIDLPSVDREEDEGKLLAHKAFWNVKDVNNLNTDARLDCTITEMIFVDDTIQDGSYVLNLQMASFENDASPSKPILYSVHCSENSVQ